MLSLVLNKTVGWLRQRYGLDSQVVVNKPRDMLVNEVINGVVGSINGVVESINGVVESINGVVESINGVVESINGVVVSIRSSGVY